MRAALALAVLLLAGAAAAQAPDGEPIGDAVPPRPGAPPVPARPPNDPIADTAPRPLETAPVPVPAPRRDAATGTPIGDGTPVRRTTPPLPPREPARRVASAAPASPEDAGRATMALPGEGPACEDALTAAGAMFEVAAALSEDACGAARPLRLVAVGPVALAGGATLRCPAALAFARWVDEVVVPTARLQLGVKNKGRTRRPA